MTEQLFVYGTLRDPMVQRRVFGRIVDGTPAVLDGFIKVTIDDGSAMYPVAVQDEQGSMEGLVIEVTADELLLSDRYETEAYTRAQVTLQSGVEVWIYRG